MSMAYKYVRTNNFGERIESQIFTSVDEAFDKMNEEIKLLVSFTASIPGSVYTVSGDNVVISVQGCMWKWSLLKVVPKLTKIRPVEAVKSVCDDLLNHEHSNFYMVVADDQMDDVSISAKKSMNSRNHYILYVVDHISGQDFGEIEMKTMNETELLSKVMEVIGAVTNKLVEEEFSLTAQTLNKKTGISVKYIRTSDYGEEAISAEYPSIEDALVARNNEVNHFYSVLANYPEAGISVTPQEALVSFDNHWWKWKIVDGQTEASSMGRK